MKHAKCLLLLMGGLAWLCEGCSNPPVDDDADASTYLDADGETSVDTDVDAADAPDSDSDEEREPPIIIEECGPESPESLAGCVEQERYIEDLEFIADVRPPGSPHWQAVQDLCATRLEALGFDVARHDFGTGVNVVGTLAGAELPEDQVIVSAHYDHVVHCEGANDNASGVAGSLEAARVLAQSAYRRTLIVICWDQEEDGRQGSFAYVDEALLRRDNIVVNFVLDMIGYTDDEPGSQEIPDGIDLLFPDLYERVVDNEFRGNFIVITADEFAHEPAELVFRYSEALGVLSAVLELSTELKNHAMTADLRGSDHEAFWAADYPAMLINDTAGLRDPNYHCFGGPDTPERLDHDFAQAIIQSTVGAAATTLEVQ